MDEDSEQRDEDSPGFRPGDTREMSDAQLQATAAQADPDDLGGTGDGPGLTAGGTGTSVEIGTTAVEGGAIGGHNYSPIVGGESNRGQGSSYRGEDEDGDTK